MRKLCIFQCMLLIASSAVAQMPPVIEWEKALGGSGSDQANAVEQTADGGYIVAGATNSTNGNVTGNHGGYDYWVSRLDGSGTLMWQKALGGSADDRAYAIEQTDDGGYVVVGSTLSTNGDVTGNHGLMDLWVVKLNTSGVIQWQNALGGTAIDAGSAIHQTSDGGYVIAGSTQSTDGDVTGHHGGTDYWVLKLDAVGELQWQSALGGTGADFANSIEQTSDGGYIVAGNSESNDGDVTGNHGGGDYWIVKLDGSGDIEWQSAMGGTGGFPGDIASSVRPTLDGGFIVAGLSSSNDGNVSGNNGGVDAWVIKLDGTGSIQWQKALGGSGFDEARSVDQTIDGGFVVAGSSSSNDGDVSGNHGGAYDQWVLKLDNAGEIQWQSALGGAGDDRAYSIEKTSDNGFVLSGFSNSSDGDVTGGHGGYDYWVVRLATDPSFLPDHDQEHWLSLYPNPSSGSVTLVSTDEHDPRLRVDVYDSAGQLVATFDRSHVIVTGDQITIALDGLPAGVYSLLLMSQRSIGRSRCIKL